MSKSLTTDNFEKHSVKPAFKKLQFLQRFLIDNFYKVLLDEVKRLKPATILDAGCGEGITLQKLKDAKIGKKLEGFDALDRAIKIGKKLHPQLSIKKGNIYQIQSRDDAYDVVICSEVLEHLERPEEALKELVRVSKRYIVVSVPNEPLFMLGNFLRGKNVKRWGNDPEHIQHWTNRKFAEFVAKHAKIRTNITPLPWSFIVAEKV
jgi:2-polyprenyl-3-methyl-5-hydroxy-6-metoxy-1,4-benzoquinol methylase